MTAAGTAGMAAATMIEEGTTGEATGANIAGMTTHAGKTMAAMQKVALRTTLANLNRL
jgi:hypothetical protein